MRFQVDGLTKRYGRKVAVDDVSFEVGGGEVVGLLGPNGAGKSTTFLCAAGLLRPDAGAFSIDGTVLESDRAKLIALIPETPEVYPLLTVWDHLVFVAKSCRLSEGWEARARNLLERFSMWPSRDVLGIELSKGMRQKTLLAATLLAQTPVVLFDEPTIGLDPAGQRELREIIRALRAHDVAMMVSTHQLYEAQQLCDRVVILKGGRMIAEGTFDELRARSSSGATAEDLFLELTR